MISTETWFIPSGKTGFRIVTSDDSVAHKIMARFEKDMSKFTYLQRKDRKGNYWERSFYFKKEHYTEVIDFIHRNFKP